MEAPNKDALLEEKAQIEQQLAKHKQTEHGTEAKFTDLGTDEDDNAHEVEQYEIDTTIVATLEKRLEEINSTLESME